MYIKYLYRPDDGERFTLDLISMRYTMDNSNMNPKYSYSYESLVDGCGFVTSIELCNIKRYVSKNDGHGNGDFDE